MATHDPKPSPGRAQSPLSHAKSLLALGLEEDPAGESQHYRPLRELARGGMGVVFDAHDAKLKRSVAVKVMQARHASAEQRQRFYREAHVLSQLAHPNIVPIYDLGTDELGRPFYAMKLVGGCTLHDILQRLQAGDPDTVARYPLNALLTVLQKVCDAIAFAHARGVLHRDLKPHNIMVGEFGEVLVMDWGLAKILPGSPLAAESSPSAWATVPGLAADVQPAHESEAETIVSTPTSAASTPAPGIVHSSATGFSRPADSQMTLAGVVMGTPSYMSPEQAAGLVEEVGPQSDVFALGGLLYAVLTLHPPVRGKTREEILSKVRAGEIVPPTRHSSRPAPAASTAAASSSAPRQPSATPLPHLPRGRVPEALSAVAMRALAVDRARRYPSVAAFAADLVAYQGGFATSAEQASFGRQAWLLARRHRVATAALAVILLLSIGFVARLMVSERRAEQSADAATKARDAAQASGEAARKALARSQISLAEAAYRELDSRTMIAALDAVPSDLREGDWAYLRHQADNSQAQFTAANGRFYIGAAGHPLLPGVFALASTERAIHLVDARTGKRHAELPLNPQQAKSQFIRSLDISRDGTRLLAGSLLGGGIAIYDLGTRKPVLEWDAPNTDHLRFSPSGLHILDINRQQELSVRDAVTGQTLWTRKPFNRALFTATGQLIAFGGKKLQRLDALTGAVIEELPPVRGSLFLMALSPDGTTLYYTTSGDVLVRGMRLTDGAHTFERSLTESSGQWPSVVVSADGRQVIGCVSDDNHKTVLRVWDAATGTQLRTLRGHHCDYEFLAIHPLSDDVLATGQETHSWALAKRSPAWELVGTRQAGVFLGTDDLFTGTGAPLQLKEPGRWNDRVAPLPAGFAGRLHAASTAGHGVIGIYGSRGAGISGAEFLLARATDGGLTLTPGKLVGRTPVTIQLHPSPDGKFLAACDDFSGLSLHETATGNLVSKAHPAADLHQLRAYGWLTPDRLIGLGMTKPRGEAGGEERVILWEAPSGRVLHHRINASAMDCLASLPGGRQFAEAGVDKRVRIRDGTTLAVLREFRAHDGPITALAAHPTEPLLATASADLRIRIWNLSDGRMMEELPPSSAAPQTLQFSPSGNRLASVDQRGKVRIWDFGHRAPGVAQAAAK